MFSLKFATFVLTVTTLFLIEYAIAITLAGVLIGMTSEVIISTVGGIICALWVGHKIAPAVDTVSTAVVNKISFATSKLSRFIREKKDEYEAYRFNKSNGFSIARV